MPYIEQRRRPFVTPPESKSPPLTTGELNYQFTILAKRYLDTHGLSYDTINDIVGAFDGAKVEFQRRVAAPYEDTKLKQNGDVYESSKG